LLLITELEFKSLALQGYNRIPLIAEAFADLETPLSLYLKLAHAKGGGKLSFLLESVVGGERFGRYSFIGLPARTFLRATGFGADAKTEVVTDGQVVETRRQPAGLHRGLPEALQGGAAAGPAALLRRPGRLLRLRHGALHREEAGKELPARHAGLPRHPAAAVRGAGGHRQPLGQAVPDRLCRPGKPEAYANGKKRCAS
jgi:anthranilate/para-aminobenzoate synthase component I